MPVVQKKVTELDPPAAAIADEDLFYMVDMDGESGAPKGTKVTAKLLADYFRFATAGIDLWTVKRSVYRNLAVDAFGEQATNFAGTSSNSGPTATQPLMGDIRTNSTLGNVAGNNGLAQYWLNRRFWFTGVLMPVNSDSRYWLGGLITAANGTTLGGSATPAQELLAFRYDPGAGDATWKFCSSDGATFLSTDTGVAPDFSAPSLFEWRLQDDNTIDVYLDRDLVIEGFVHNYPLTTTSRLVGTVTNLVGGANKSFRFGQWQVAQYYL